MKCFVHCDCCSIKQWNRIVIYLVLYLTSKVNQVRQVNPPGLSARYSACDLQYNCISLDREKYTVR